MRSGPTALKLAPAGNLERAPGLAAAERWLVLLFLSRNVTWCARCRGFAQMQGAALLHKDIAQSAERDPSQRMTKSCPRNQMNQGLANAQALLVSQLRPNLCLSSVTVMVTVAMAVL